MSQTIGYHIVIAGYGLWLPGDERGFWSTKWDADVGLVEPHTLHPGDPVRLRISQERLLHPPNRLTPRMIEIVADTLASCAGASDWAVAALCVLPTHSHLLLTPTERNIDNTIKWLKHRMTRALHDGTSYNGPVWCKGKWRSFLFDVDVWGSTQEYIENHNVGLGLGARPYPFVNPSFPA